MDLDDVDRRILRLLQEDARRSYRDLAEACGVSTPTVSAKVRALEGLGLVRGYRVVLDPKVLGRTGHVLELETRPALARALAQRLEGETGVQEVLELAGGRLHVRYFASSPAALQSFLDTLGRMDEVQTFRLHHVLSERAGTAPLLEEGDALAVDCHECKGPIHGSGVRKRFSEEKDARDHWFCCRGCAGRFGERLARLAQG